MSNFVDEHNNPKSLFSSNQVQRRTFNARLDYLIAYYIQLAMYQEAISLYEQIVENSGTIVIRNLYFFILIN